MYKNFGQFIDGKWSPSTDGGTYEVINPSNEEILGHASKATSADVEKSPAIRKKRIRNLEKNFTMGKICQNKKNSRFNSRKKRCYCKMDFARSW